MLFSYYFDPEKNHLLNFQYKMLQYTEKEAGVIEIMFSAEISEILNKSVKKRETIVKAFSFPPTTDKNKHDIDFTRVRYGNEKKWIFTVINNKDASQSAQVGLISNSANKNPLGMDVYHTDETYFAILKANNLSILENTYQAPILNQTVVNTGFNTAGYPERFSSYTAKYNQSEANYTVKDFTQDFLEPIPTEASFEIKMDIAPQSVSPAVGSKLFFLNIKGLGVVTCYKSGIEFKIEGGSEGSAQYAAFAQEINPLDLFANGVMTAAANLKVIGDGHGNLTITYAGATLNASYDQTKSISSLEFRGEYAGQNI